MKFVLDDNIAALASAPGPAARGIVRMSGPGVLGVLTSLFEADEPGDWQNHRAAERQHGRVHLSSCAAPLQAAAYIWPHARSYTGQPLAELHTIGSPPLLEALLTELYQAGMRPARPGEFTLRAFLAGRIDLLQAEAVLGVIDAHDHRQLELALRQLAGGISGRLGEIRENLIDLLADLEAGLDFAEEDVQFIPGAELVERLSRARAELDRLLAQAADRMRSTGRLRVVLAGLPNAGKSTLFNALVGREAALVSEIRGTTRDYLAVPLNWNETAIELIDTAGWDDDTSVPMQSAQLLRAAQLDRADLVIWCTAADLEASSLEADEARRRDIQRGKQPLLWVVTKGDLSCPPWSNDGLCISARTGSKLPDLIGAAVVTLARSASGTPEILGTTAARCRESLTTAVASLTRAVAAAQSGAGEEVVAIEIREALEHLGRILGTVYIDDILDRIFSKFCIGK